MDEGVRLQIKSATRELKNEIQFVKLHDSMVQYTEVISGVLLSQSLLVTGGHKTAKPLLRRLYSLNQSGNHRRPRQRVPRRVF